MWAHGGLSTHYMPGPWRHRKVCPAFTLEGLVCGELPDMHEPPWLCAYHLHLVEWKVGD